MQQNLFGEEKVVKRKPFDYNDGGNIITPVEFHNGLLFKREDLYVPFEDSDLNGSKCRQMDNLIKQNLLEITSANKSKIITYCSVHSPQSLIFAKVAEKYGLKGIILIGGGSPVAEAIKKHHFLQESIDIKGISIINVTKMPYNNVLYARMKEINETENAFVVKFGFDNPEYERAVIDPVAWQAQNIPDDLDNLIIPVGSAICTKGIIKGLIEYKKLPRTIICIQIAGYDRAEVINEFLIREYGMKLLARRNKDYSVRFTFKNSWDDGVTNYEFVKDTAFKYDKLIRKMFAPGQWLDPRYEAKAYLKYLCIKDKLMGTNNLFWIIANNC